MSARTRDVLWRSWNGPGLEHLCFSEDAGGAVADGVVVAATDERRYRLRYHVVTDADWRVREVTVELLGEPDRVVTLRADDPVERAVDLIADGSVHSVLVLDAARRLVGIVTDTDLLDYLCG